MYSNIERDSVNIMPAVDIDKDVAFAHKRNISSDDVYVHCWAWVDYEHKQTNNNEELKHLIIPSI